MITTFPEATSSSGAAGRLIGKSGLSVSTSLTQVTVTSGASTSSLTFGSWTQVVASSAGEYLVLGAITAVNDTTTGYAIQVGYGGSGSETALSIAFISPSQTANTAGYAFFSVPARIPGSSRIAVRTAALGSSTIAPSVILHVAPWANIEGN